MDRTQGSTRPQTNDRADNAPGLSNAAILAILVSLVAAYRGLWVSPGWGVLGLYATLAAVAAAMVGRWCRAGAIPWFLAVFATTAAIFRGTAGDALLATLTTLAIAAFAVANVYGQRPLGRSGLWPWLYSLGLAAAVAFGGLAGLAVATLPCLATAAFNSDARGVRFVLRPINWLAAALAGVARLWRLGDLWAALFGTSETTAMLPFADGLETLSQLAWALSPWWPVAAAAIVLGVRLGHYATPFWRLCGAWLAVGLGLAIVKLATVELTATLILPPLALISSHALRAARSQLAAMLMRPKRQTRPAIDVALIRVRRRPSRLRPARGVARGAARQAVSR